MSMELTFSQTKPNSMVLSKEEQQECIKLLKKSILLRECDESQLRDLARKMEKRAYKKGDVLVKEGTPQSRMFVVAEGEALREKTINGQVHHIDTNLGGVTIGSLHVLNKDPAYATTKCMTDVVAYEMSSDDLKSMFVSNPDFASNITKSLTSEVRRYTRNFSTPLVLEHPKRTPILAVSVAASIESFYRAALNSVLNQQLTGQKSATLFPNMHIQIPTRVVYINGFKGIRQYLDSNFRPENYSNPTAMGLLFAVTPGVCMTPISSILEASNAGHSNPEPLYTRWSRGLLPRGAREVIFGVGLNQLSDYCEERVPYFENQTLRNAVGSMSAGVISGYLSHVVHNMSTLKLLNPNKTYWQHFQEYSAKAEARLPQSWSPDTRRVTSYFTSCIFPKGYLVRTAQIVGSFMILNGTINAMQKWMNGNSNNGNGNQK